MVTSNHLNLGMPRWLSVALAICALGLLPPGMAQAKEPDYEAVGTRLLRAVEAGELTPQQAQAMMGGLAGARFAERLHEARSRRGKRGGDDSIESHYNKLGVDDETLARVRGHLRENGLSKEQVQASLMGILRLVHQLRKEEHFELHPEMLKWLEEEVRLSGEQIRMVVGLAKRLALGGQRDERGNQKRQREEQRGGDERDGGIDGHFGRLGIDAGGVAKIRGYLEKNGLNDDQMEGAMGGVLRIIHGMRSAGEDYELNPGMRDYLTKRLRLNDEQTRLVLRIAQRFAQVGQQKKRGEGRGDRGEQRPQRGEQREEQRSERRRGGDERDGGIDGHFGRLGIDAGGVARIRGYLEKNGLNEDQVEGALRGMVRLIPAMRTAGKDFKMDQRMRDYFMKTLRLSEEQTKMALGIARRFSQVGPRKQRGDRQDQRRQRGKERESRLH